MVLCSTVAFLSYCWSWWCFFACTARGRLMAVLPMATFNTCILGTLFISTIQSFSLVQTMGFALGSGVGYVLAVQVVTEGAAQAAERRGAGHVPRAAHHAAVYRHPGSGHLRLYRPYAGILTAAPAACRGNAAGGLCGFSGRVPAAEAGLSMSGPARRHSGHGAAAPREQNKRGSAFMILRSLSAPDAEKILLSDVYGGGPRAAQRGVRAGAGPSAGADWAAHRAGL